ncbi:dihydropteroate synthase [Brachybacterium saurashtrense]|uniref:Dihydropteroate synthase n=1 Tax=Brachybacterium saurashtrense TaxID=556288 RepID=A0A345YLL4_9MICO|nr:dihydropteroate synthase [Brachybacterium saurashtrense]AXK44816.1 dihydropteroate synthase [Brachybacterium saurashtrense]RRR20792.1 dihydropteroate synthase [Brachybacterium saurashtrense]
METTARRPEGLPARLGGDDTLVMGVLNVTPDSFSDGGAHADAPAALAHGRRLVAEGAAIVDVGGESTRPGAPRVDEDEELRRVIPVVSALAAEDVVVSVDTMRASVAAASVEAGALIVNDVSAGRADVDMGREAALLRTRLGTPPVFIAMHWRGHSDVMNELAVYEDVARQSTEELAARLDALREAGVEDDFLVADPGLGFSKTGEQNWELLAHWDAIASHGLPVLIGASRKRFVSALGADRDLATAAISAYSAEHGAWAVRVHEIAPSLAAVRVGDRLRRSGRR